ncbi:MAG: acyl carrier protein [Acidobacteriota bacterium]|jgi:acyl carrier protein
MSEDEILRVVAELAQRHLGCSGPITLDMDLIDDLRLDSLKLLTLAVQVENRFEICFEPDEEAQIRSVGDLVSAIATKAGAQSDRSDEG